MNIDTGNLRILSIDECEEMLKVLSGPYKEAKDVLIDKEDLTEKQAELMKVSLHDNRSKAGKKLQEARKDVRYKGTPNQKRKIRNRLKND